MNHRKKLLVSGDSGLFQALGHSLFHREDLDLMVAHGGRQALAVTERERPDLAILDLDLPELSGDECCRRAKADPALRKIPFLLAPARPEGDEVERCRQAGCDGIFPRPIDSLELLAAARRLLGLPERSFPRLRTRFPVHYRGGRIRRTDPASDLGTGGLFIETRKPAPLDRLFSLEFTLPDRQAPIRCRGCVAWVNPPAGEGHQPRLRAGMGLQFLFLERQDQAAIRDHLRRLHLCGD